MKGESNAEYQRRKETKAHIEILVQERDRLIVEQRALLNKVAGLELAMNLLGAKPDA